MGDSGENPAAVQTETTDKSGDESGGEGKAIYDELISGPQDEFDLPQDCWGAGILVMIKDLADMLAMEAFMGQWIRFCFITFCNCLNLYLQIAILKWIYVYIINYSVRKIQIHYQHYHEMVYDADSHFVESQWEDFPYRDTLCQAVMTQQLFLGAVLFFWVARMLTEFRQTERLIRYIASIPGLPAGVGVEDMVHEKDDGDHPLHLIVCLNRPTRLCIFTFVLIPKLLISIILLVLGMQWLTSTESFGDLLLNALALEFIINIDELIFECFFPVSVGNNLAYTKIAIPKQPSSDEKVRKQLVVEYTRSFVYLVITFVIVYVYLMHVQQVLPGYNGDITHCTKFIQDHFSPECVTSFADMLSGTTSCFPYGTGPEAGEDMSAGLTGTKGGHHKR